MICACRHIADVASKGVPQGAFAGKDAPWPVKISFVNKIVPLWSGRIVSVMSGACLTSQLPLPLTHDVITRVHRYTPYHRD